MWEKRYNIFSPQRTKTNIRRYNDDDVRFIINLSLLLKRGFRISKLATLSLDELSELASKFVSDNKPGQPNIEPLITATIQFDEEALLAPINNAAKEMGITRAYEYLVLPFLQKIGELWQTGAIYTTHEHFASNVIRNQLSFLYRQCKQPNVGKSSPIIFFLPEGEFHEIGLLYFAYVAKNAGYQTIYLGQSTPSSDAINMAKELKCKMVFTSLSSLINTDFDNAYGMFVDQLPDLKILATGHAFAEVDTPPQYLTFIGSANDLLKVIAEIDPTMVK